MTHAQDTTQAQAALLRNDSGIATPLTDCGCEAASIIDPLSATTEGLVPHEKLREAATPKASLIALDRPPAQPVKGYKNAQRIIQPQDIPTELISLPRGANTPRHILVRSCPDQSYFTQLSSRDRNNLRVIRKDCSAPQHILFTAIREQSSKRYALFQRASDRQKGLNHFGKRQVRRTNPIQGHQVRLNGGKNLGLERDVTGLHILKILEKNTASHRCLLRNILSQLEDHNLSLVPCSNSITSLFIANIKSGKYSSYTPNSLKPGGCVFFQIKRVKYDPKRPTQRTYCENRPNNPDTGSRKSRRNTEPLHSRWLRAINDLQSMPSSMAQVHGEAR